MGRAATGVRAAGFAAAVAACYAWLSASSVPQAPVPPPAAAEPAASRLLPTAPPKAMPIVSTEGLILYGVSGAAAIIGSRLGGQRVVEVGRDYRPGLKLADVGIDYAILRDGSHSVKLELSRYAAGGSAKAAAALPAEEEQKIESAVLRSILKPVKTNDRIGGYALRPGESLPQLIRAGLRPGDVIVSVNGSQLDEERMSELAWQMGNTAKTEFIFVRDGKKMRAYL